MLGWLSAVNETEVGRQEARTKRTERVEEGLDEHISGTG